MPLPLLLLLLFLLVIPEGDLLLQLQLLLPLPVILTRRGRIPVFCSKRLASTLRTSSQSAQ